MCTKHPAPNSIFFRIIFQPVASRHVQPVTLRPDVSQHSYEWNLTICKWKYHITMSKDRTTWWFIDWATGIWLCYYTLSVKCRLYLVYFQNSLQRPVVCPEVSWSTELRAPPYLWLSLIRVKHQHSGLPSSQPSLWLREAFNLLNYYNNLLELAPRMFRMPSLKAHSVPWERLIIWCDSYQEVVTLSN